MLGTVTHAPADVGLNPASRVNLNVCVILQRDEFISSFVGVIYEKPLFSKYVD
jgi:hypothetical protein